VLHEELETNRLEHYVALGVGTENSHLISQHQHGMALGEF